MRIWVLLTPGTDAPPERPLPLEPPHAAAVTVMAVATATNAGSFARCDFFIRDLLSDVCWPVCHCAGLRQPVGGVVSPPRALCRGRTRRADAAHPEYRSGTRA